MSPKLKRIAKLTLSIIVIIAVSLYLQINVVSHPETVTNWLSSFGPSIILVYALIQILAIVIPPIPGALVSIPILALFGPLKGLVLIYLVSTPAECVNFLISKKYGRKVVTKLIGEKSMEKVDHYTEDAGFGSLVVLKLFADSYYDFVSYGLGLTKITFQQFVFVQIVFGLMRTALSYIILSNAPNFTSSIIMLEIAAGLLTGGYILVRRQKHKKSLEELPPGEIR